VWNLKRENCPVFILFALFSRERGRIVVTGRPARLPSASTTTVFYSVFFFFWTFGFLVHVRRSLEVDAVAEYSRCEWVDDEAEGFSIATII
jgi:hypothetical protein